MTATTDRDPPCMLCDTPLSRHGLLCDCAFFCKRPEPLTDEWFLANGFAREGEGFFRYVHDYTGLHAYLDRGQVWRWRLEEHRDNLNWDDKFFTLPRPAMAQTVDDAKRLLQVMGAR